MASPSVPTISLHAPDTNVPAFAEAAFPFERFLGTWHIVRRLLLRAICPAA